MKRLLATTGFLLAFVAAAQAHTVNFTWTAPSLYTDGVTALPLTQITDFKIYQTDLPAPGLPGTLVATVTGPFSTSSIAFTFTSTTITSGSHTFVVVTDTTNGAVSAPSNILTVVIPNLAAQPITNFAGTAVN